MKILKEEASALLGSVLSKQPLQNRICFNLAFTLAEMAVVLLIMTVIMAAMAPVMTTRLSGNKVAQGGGAGGTSIWKYVEDSGDTDIYYGTKDNQRAMIGQNKAETAENARLILNTSDDIPNHLMFRKGTDTLGVLSMDKNQSILLGTLSNGTSSLDDYLIAIGKRINVTKNDFGGRAGIAIGTDTRVYGTSYDSSSIAIGDTSNAGESAVAIGGTASSLRSIAIGGTATGQDAIAIGTSAYSNNTGAIAIGWEAASTGAGIAIGECSKADSALAIGVGANASAFGTAIGRNTKVENDGDIAFGGGAEATNDSAIALGTSTRASGKYSLAIGNYVRTSSSSFGYTTSSGEYSIALGVAAEASGLYSIAIGSGNSPSTNKLNNTTASGNYSVAIGYNAKATTANTIVLGTASETVQIPGSLTVATTNYPSDKRLKNIDKEYTSGLDKIKNLKPYNFTYKDDKTKTPRVGVIAQDLKKVFPDAVSKGKDGFLTIRLEDMFYALINAVKELDLKVTQLIKQESDKDKKIKELEKRLEILESKIK